MRFIRDQQIDRLGLNRRYYFGPLDESILLIVIACRMTDRHLPAARRSVAFEHEKEVINEL